MTPQLKPARCSRLIFPGRTRSMLLPGVCEAGFARPRKGRITQGNLRLAAGGETGVPKTARRRGKGKRPGIGGWVSPQPSRRGDYSHLRRSTRPTNSQPPPAVQDITASLRRQRRHPAVLWSLLASQTQAPSAPALLPRRPTAVNPGAASFPPLPTVFWSPQTHLPRPRGNQHLLQLLKLSDWLSRDVAVNQPIPAPSRDQADQLTVGSGSEAGPGNLRAEGVATASSAGDYLFPVLVRTRGTPRGACAFAWLWLCVFIAPPWEVLLFVNVVL